MKKKINFIVESSYNELKNINKKIKKKYSLKIILKGKFSEFDSVDLITFFSILDNKFIENQLIIPEFFDDQFFFKYNNINIKDLINYISEKI
tara:strand:+ start:503 stop:778 length:276 start_codon:yes stop_codon:yes gene_type:complete